MHRKSKVPTAVLVKAKAAALKKVVAPVVTNVRPRASTADAEKREKVIAALKKLHPMD